MKGLLSHMGDILYVPYRTCSLGYPPLQVDLWSRVVVEVSAHAGSNISSSMWLHVQESVKVYYMYLCFQESSYASMTFT